MHIACFAFGLFALSFAVHWTWWRVRVPRRQSAALLGIFLAALPIGLAVAWLVPELRARLPWDVWSLLHIAVVHVSLTLAYIVTYSGLEERSPSMTLLMNVAESGGQGRTLDELYFVLRDVSPVDLRLAAMVRDQMVEKRGATYAITPKGRVWAVTFGSWRRLVGLEKGG